MVRRNFNALPGFGLTMGFTLFYLSAIVLFPMGALLLRATGVGWHEFWEVAFAPRAVAAYKLTFAASFVAACINAVFGSILAWVLVRYHFRGKRVIDALVDIPFALPTAVAGLTLANLFNQNGWLGQFFAPFGIKTAYSEIGVVIALTFVSMPFIVRTLQPVIEGLEREVEEAAATLGAGRFRTFIKVVAPTLAPTLVTGFALSFARAVGEYGSVIFISSNMQFKTEITPLVIISMLEQYEYGAAISIAVVLLIISFVMLIVINFLERWASRYQT
jgi:sulfate transport system permease protein